MAVSTGCKAHHSRCVVWQLIVPEEAFQLDIGGVCDSEAIEHIASRKRLPYSALYYADAKNRGPLIVRDLYDLPCVFECNIKFLRGELPVSRSGHFTDDIPAKRQRRGGCDASCVGCYISDHNAAALTHDLIYCAGNRSTCCLPGNRVVLSGKLRNLYLTRDGSILPFDSGKVTVRNVNALFLRIEDISFCGFQLTDIVPAGRKRFIGIGVAVLIRDDLLNGFSCIVIDHELYAVNTFAGDRIGFVNCNSADLCVRQVEMCCFAVLDLHSLRRSVELIAVRSLQLSNAVPALFKYRKLNNAVAVSCICSDDFTVKLSYLELYARNTRAGVLIGFSNDKSALRCIVKGQILRVVGINDHRLSLASDVNRIAGQRFNFSNNERSRHAVNCDLSGAVGSINATRAYFAAVIIYNAPVGIAHFKGHPLKRLFRDRVKLADNDRALARIPEGEILNGSGFYLNILRSTVEHKAVNRLYLLNLDGSSRLKTGENEFTLCVGVVNSVVGTDGSTLPVNDLEGDSGERLIVRASDVLVNY